MNLAARRVRPPFGIAGVLAVSALVGRPAAAQRADGPEFRASIQTTGDERAPDVAVSPNGTFLITWKGADVCTGCLEFQYFLGRPGTPTDYQAGVAPSLVAGPSVASLGLNLFVIAYAVDSPNEVIAQRTTGPPGGLALPATIVSSTTANAKQAVDVAADAAGNFVVVWQSAADQDGSGSGIYARRVLSNGEPRGMGGEFRVNTTTSGDQRGPRVASAADGSFVVTWQSGTSNAKIYAQRYAATGAPAGGEFLVSTNTAVGNYFPDVASDGSGNFVVAWTAYNQYSGYNYNVLAQRYDASGAAAGAIFRVNAQTFGTAGRPKVTKRSGDFVVAWDEFQTDSSGYAVNARRYASDGSSLGGIFRVNTYTTGSQYSAAIASSAGRYVIVWQSGPGIPPVGGAQDGSGLGIYAQKYCLGGDANLTGAVDVADVFFLINALFAGGPPPCGCGDANGSSAIDVTDVFFLINYLFAGGPPPV